MWLLFMLATYGLMFLFHYHWELEFIHDNSDTLSRLLDCPFCLGFWISWVLWFLAEAFGIVLVVKTDSLLPWLLLGFVWAFANSAFCLIVDEIVIWMEH